MNNYANWEITQLLPTNSYQSYLFIDEDNDIIADSSAELIGAKRAWTWEEIRLYLESKNYRLSTSFDTNDRNYHCVDVWNFEEEGYLESSFKGDTYEQAREEAIKYCLNVKNPKD